MVKYKSVFLCLIIAFILNISAVLFAGGEVKPEQRTYTVGVVPQFDSTQISKIWTPILKELGRRAGCRFQLQGSPTIPDFEKEFIAGKFDFAYMNPYHVLIAHDREGYIPLIRDLDTLLYGIVVVRKDSAVKSMADLEGEVVVFPAPNALGASLMTRAAFNDVFHIQITPKYVQTHTSVYLNVVLDEAMAGGGVQKTLEKQPLEIRNKLRVIYKTATVAPHPFVSHPRVPDETRKKVLISFLALGKSDEGKELLKKAPINKVGSAFIEDYEPLKLMKLDRFYKKD